MNSKQTFPECESSPQALRRKGGEDLLYLKWVLVEGLYPLASTKARWSWL